MAKFTFSKFVREQRTPLPAVLKADLAGKTVIVTGANIGLGLAAAKHFAAMNPGKLIIACRSQSKGEAALHEIREETGYVAELRLLDLARFSSVIEFVDALERDNVRVDIVVANAAIASAKFELSGHGYEQTIQVNHLSTALLALRMIPLLERTAKDYNVEPRLTIVASEVHFWTSIKPQEMQRENILEAYSDPAYSDKFKVMADRYNLTKLLNVFFTRSLSAHLSPTSPVVVDCVNPGMCYSALDRELPWFMIPIMWTMRKLFARTSEAGARTFIWAALAGDDSLVGGGNKALREDIKGQYTNACHTEEPSDFVLSKEGIEAERRVWGETLEILTGADPKLKEVVARHLV